MITQAEEEWIGNYLVDQWRYLKSGQDVTSLLGAIRIMAERGHERCRWVMGEWFNTIEGQKQRETKP